MEGATHDQAQLKLFLQCYSTLVVSSLAVLPVSAFISCFLHGKGQEGQAMRLLTWCDASVSVCYIALM